MQTYTERKLLLRTLVKGCSLCKEVVEMRRYDIFCGGALNLAVVSAGSVVLQCTYNVLDFSIEVVKFSIDSRGEPCITEFDEFFFSFNFFKI